MIYYKNNIFIHNNNHMIFHFVVMVNCTNTFLNIHVSSHFWGKNPTWSFNMC